MSVAQRILIVGCGDLGTRAARLLAAPAAPHAGLPAEVWGLRRHPPTSQPMQPGDPIWIAADIGDPATLSTLPAGITQVMFCQTPGGRTPEAYARAFLDGPRNILNALDRAVLERIVFVSSSAVYGDHAGAWIDESTPTGPLGFNGRILCEAEASLWHDFPATVVLRLAGLYGPGRTQLLDRLRRGEAHVPPASPPQWANRMHIEDAAGACAHLLTLAAPESLYLGADDTPLPLDILYRDLAHALGAPVPTLGDPPKGVGSKRMRNARLRQSGFVPRWPDAREGYRVLIAPT